MNVKISDRLLYQAGEARIPISGTFELTPMCNFACKMCYVRKEPQEVEQMGGLRKVEEWLNWAEQARKAGMLYLLITGGEPFTYPGFWELYSRLTKMGFVITINSNGSMITKQVVSRLSEMPPKKINITLYGATNESYEALCGAKNGFDRVMEAGRLLKAYGIPYRYNCSLTPYNCHEQEEMFRVAKGQGTSIEIATYMFPPVRRNAEDSKIRLSPEEAGYYSVESMFLQLEEEQFRAYARRQMEYETPPEIPASETGELKGRAMSCRAGRCSFWLDWQGNLSACGMINVPSYSLRQETFEQAWQHVVDDTNKVLCLAECSNCKNRKICHACISTAYCETGRINGRPVYMCEMLSAEAEACKKKLHKLNEERG